MDRVSAANYQTIGGKRFWQDKNTLLGIVGTTFAAVWGAGVQESIIAPTEALGIVPADSGLGSADTQLLQSMKVFAGANIHATITATPGAPLAITDAGQIVVDATAGSIVITVPAVAAANGQQLRYRFIRKDAVTANSVTIAFHAGDSALIGGATSVTIAALTTLELTGDGVSHWIAISPLTAAQFPSSLGTPGWKKYPDPNSASGYFIEQWGYSSVAINSTATFTLPIAFPSAVDSVVCSFAYVLSGGQTYTAGASGTGLSQITITVVASAGTTNGVNWIIKGH